ncbi:MAG: hypothetical protein AAF378_11095 [Cyanobacteria bacterium P01_A01_bin.84]
MLETYLLLLLIGIATIWGGIKVREEVYRIATVLTGAMLVVLGFILSPSYIQFLVVLFLLGLHRLYAKQFKF